MGATRPGADDEAVEVPGGDALAFRSQAAGVRQRLKMPVLRMWPANEIDEMDCGLWRSRSPFPNVAFFSRAFKSRILDARDLAATSRSDR